jgi:hypothetical protein
MFTPENRPERYVIIEKTCSTLTDHIETATIAIQSYGETLLDAMQINEAVKASMFNAIESNAFSKIELNSDYNFTDTATKRPRMQAVFVVTGTNI